MRLCVGACVGAGMCVCTCAHAYDALVQIVHSRTKVDSLTTVTLLYTAIRTHARSSQRRCSRGLSFGLRSAPCSEHPPTSRSTHCVPWYGNKPHNTTGHAKCLLYFAPGRFTLLLVAKCDLQTRCLAITNTWPCFRSDENAIAMPPRRRHRHVAQFRRDAVSNGVNAVSGLP